MASPQSGQGLQQQLHFSRNSHRGVLLLLITINAVTGLTSSGAGTVSGQVKDLTVKVIKTKK